MPFSPPDPETADTPEPPTENRPNREDDDKPREQGVEYSFNMGMWRIETLNNILVGCAKKYRKALHKKDVKSLHEYQDLVNTLFTETYIYMKEETEIEHKDVELDKKSVLSQILDDYNEPDSDEELLKELQEIRNVYLSVRELLQRVGLDIPKKDKVKKTEIFGK